MGAQGSRWPSWVTGHFDERLLRNFRPDFHSAALIIFPLTGFKVRRESALCGKEGWGLLIWRRTVCAEGQGEVQLGEAGSQGKEPYGMLAGLVVHF